MLQHKQPVHSWGSQRQKNMDEECVALATVLAVPFFFIDCLDSYELLKGANFILRLHLNGKEYLNLCASATHLYSAGGALIHLVNGRQEQM